MALAAALVGTALLPLVPASAAETLGVLAVAPPPGPDPDLVEIASQLRQVMHGKQPALVLDGRRLRERMAGPVPGATLAEIDRAYEGARSAAVGGDFEGAVRALRAILEELEKLPEGEETFQRWTTAMLRLAKSEGDLGRADAARGVLERLLRAAPGLKVDARLYPPRFTAQVEEMRTQLRSLPQRHLRVSAGAPQTRVFVDGRDVGTAPVTVSLAAGRYHVGGRSGAATAPRQVADLGAEDQAVHLDFSLTEALRPDRGPGLALPAADRAGRVVALGAYLGLDQVLVATIVQDAGTDFAAAQLYDVRRGMLKREGRVRLVARSLPPGGPGALADFLLTGERTSPIVEVAGAPLATAPTTPPIVARGQDAGGPPARGRAMGWTAVGAGALGLGLGAVSVWQAVASNGAYSDARAMLGPGGTLPPGASPAAYDRKLRDGDGARTTAIATGVGAGVCLVTAGVLGYLAYRQTGEIGPFRF